MSSMLLARGSLVVERTCRHAPRCSWWWWSSYETRSSLSASSTRFSSSSVVPFGGDARPPPSSSSRARGDVPTLPRSDDVRPFATALRPRAVVDPDSTTGSSSFAAAAAAVSPHKKTARRRVRRKRVAPSPSSPKGRGARRGPSDRPRRRGRSDGPRPSSVASSASSSPLRVFKLEQRLTYLYSSYLATMGVVVDDDHDVDGRRRRTPRRGVPSSSVRSRPRGVPLPFFAGVPTDDLGRALRESADAAWSSRRVESTDADGLRARLVASEEEYRRLQEVTRVVAKGWTMAEAPWATTTRDDRDRDRGDRRPDAVADHARAEAWWDQMERARRQRCVAVDEYRAAERGRTTWFRAATSFLRRALSSNDDDRADDDDRAVAIEGVTAHASPEYGPTTKSYALVARARRAADHRGERRDPAERVRWSEELLAKLTRYRDDEHHPNPHVDPDADPRFRHDLLENLCAVATTEALRKAETLAEDVLRDLDHAPETFRDERRRFNVFGRTVLPIMEARSRLPGNADAAEADMRRWLREEERRGLDLEPMSVRTAAAFAHTFRALENHRPNNAVDAATVERAERLLRTLGRRREIGGGGERGGTSLHVNDAYNVFVRLLASSSDADAASRTFARTEELVRSPHLFPATRTVNVALRALARGPRKRTGSVERAVAWARWHMGRDPERDNAPDHGTYAALLELARRRAPGRILRTTEAIARRAALDDGAEARSLRAVAAARVAAARAGERGAAREAAAWLASLRTRSGADPRRPRSPFVDPSLAPDRACYEAVLETCRSTADGDDDADVLWRTARDAYRGGVARARADGDRDVSRLTSLALRCARRFVRDPGRRTEALREIMVLADAPLTKHLERELRGCECPETLAAWKERDEKR